MDYAKTYDKAHVRIYASDMLLEINSDVSYLVMSQARSRYAGYFRLLKNINTPNRHLHNGAILIECKTIRHVVTSAAEAETKGVFQNTQTAFVLRHLLNAMGHPKLPNNLRTDNSKNTGLVYKNMQMKRSKY